MRNFRQPRKFLTKSQLTKKEELDVIMDLYKSHTDLFDKRRALEWRVTIGLWVGIIVITGFLFGKVNIEPVLKSFWFDIPVVVKILIISGAFALTYHFLWLKGTFLANEKDKRWSYFYKGLIHEKMDIKASSKTPAHRSKSMDNYLFPSFSFRDLSLYAEFYIQWSEGFQAITTFILMFLCLFALCYQTKITCIPNTLPPKLL